MGHFCLTMLRFLTRLRANTIYRMLHGSDYLGTSWKFSSTLMCIPTQCSPSLRALHSMVSTNYRLTDYAKFLYCVQTLLEITSMFSSHTLVCYQEVRPKIRPELTTHYSYMLLTWVGPLTHSTASLSSNYLP